MDRTTADAAVAGGAAREVNRTFRNNGQLSSTHLTPINGPSSGLLSNLDFSYYAGRRNGLVFMNAMPGSQMVPVVNITRNTTHEVTTLQRRAVGSMTDQLLRTDLTYQSWFEQVAQIRHSKASVNVTTLIDQCDFIFDHRDRVIGIGSNVTVWETNFANDSRDQLVGSDPKGSASGNKSPLARQSARCRGQAHEIENCAKAGYG